MCLEIWIEKKGPYETIGALAAEIGERNLVLHSVYRDAANLKDKTEKDYLAELLSNPESCLCPIDLNLTAVAAGYNPTFDARHNKHIWKSMEPKPLKVRYYQQIPDGFGLYSNREVTHWAGTVDKISSILQGSVPNDVPAEKKLDQIEELLSSFQFHLRRRMLNQYLSEDDDEKAAKIMKKAVKLKLLDGK